MRRALPAAVLALLSALLLVLLIFLGSRGFKDFDSALVGYAVATVFAVAAIVYRYTLWITRPPTWRYFKGGWLNFLSWRNFRRYTTLIPLAWWHDIFGQTFILKRSLARWVAHMSIFWGVLLSLAITLPLIFPAFAAGWIWVAVHVLRGFSIPLMLSSKNNQVFAVALWEFWDRGMVSMASALGVMLIIVLIPLTLIMRRFIVSVSAQER